jgi:hypothetical protein
MLAGAKDNRPGQFLGRDLTLDSLPRGEWQRDVQLTRNRHCTTYPRTEPISPRTPVGKPATNGTSEGLSLWQVS